MSGTLSLLLLHIPKKKFEVFVNYFRDSIYVSMISTVSRQVYFLFTMYMVFTNFIYILVIIYILKFWVLFAYGKMVLTVWHLISISRS